MRTAAPFLLSALAGFAIARLVLAPANPIANVSASRPMRAGASSPQIPEPAQSSRTRLSAALAGNDPLASAALMLGWLETATVADLQSLAKDPANFPVPMFSGFGLIFREAFSDALMKRWMDLDPDAALSSALAYREYGLKQPRLTFANAEADWLLEAIARTKPEFALQRLPAIQRSGILEEYAHTAFRVLGARDPVAARRFLSGIDTPDCRSRANIAIAEGVAQSDPVAAVALARELKADYLCDWALTCAGNIGPGVLRSVLAAAPDQFASSGRLPGLMIQYPDIFEDFAGVKPGKPFPGATDDVDRMISEATPEERERLLGSYDSFPEHMRGQLAAAIASAWARTEPAKAADWALTRADPTRLESTSNQPAQDVFARWIHKDRDAALAWLRAMPASPLRDCLGNYASALASDGGRIDEALALFHPLEADDKLNTVQMLAQNYARRDPAAAAAWLGTLPEGVETSRAVETLIDRWFPRDPEAVAGWVESLSAGKRRDESVNKFVLNALVEGSTVAADWVEQVADPGLRQKSAEWVYYFMKQENPAAAREWIRQLTGVDAAWHDRFLRLHP